jgi:hypothetical protein
LAVNNFLCKYSIKQFEHVCKHRFPELTNIDGKACNNIPEAVNKLALSARWTILVKLSEINMIPLIIPNKTQSFITG